jgi:hypothetical protein
MSFIKQWLRLVFLKVAGYRFVSSLRALTIHCTNNCLHVDKLKNNLSDHELVDVVGAANADLDIVGGAVTVVGPAHHVWGGVGESNGSGALSARNRGRDLVRSNHLVSNANLKIPVLVLGSGVSVDKSVDSNNAALGADGVDKAHSEIVPAATVGGGHGEVPRVQASGGGSAGACIGGRASGVAGSNDEGRLERRLGESHVNEGLGQAHVVAVGTVNSKDVGVPVAEQREATLIELVRYDALAIARAALALVVSRDYRKEQRRSAPLDQQLLEDNSFDEPVIASTMIPFKVTLTKVTAVEEESA